MRPEILFPLFTSVSTLKGVGPRVAPLVERLSGPIVRDVLFTAPTGLIRRTTTTVDQAVENQVQTFLVTIDSHQPPHRLGQPWKIRAWDGIEALWELMRWRFKRVKTKEIATNKDEEN